MDMELTPLDFSILGGEPLNSSSVPGDQMGFGTSGDLSDASLLNEFCGGSDLFLFNPPSLNTLTNKEDGITCMNPLSDSSLSLDSDFSFDGKLYSLPSSYTDDYNSLRLLEEQGFPNILNCVNLMKSPLSSEDIDSILDTASLSDGDTSLSPSRSLPESPISVIYDDNPASISPPPNEDFPVSITPPSFKEITVSSFPSLSEAIPASDSPLHCEEIPDSSSPSLYEEISSFPSAPIYLIYTNESDGAQAPNSVLEVPLGCSIGEAASRGGDDFPCLLVSSPGKEKRTKSYRTKKSPYYTWDKSTESIPSPLIDILDIPEHLSKKDKKKLQNKNAATRYRQKTKEEADIRKQEEGELLKENQQLRNRVDDIQKEIQYLKNLLKEIGKVGTKP